MKHTLYKFLTTFLCAVFLFSVLISPLSVLANENYNSIIVQTNEKLLRVRRPELVLYREGIKYFNKINKNTFVVSVEKNKSIEEQINELKRNNLFAVIEPDYKLSIDEINTKNFSRVKKHSRNNTAYINNEDDEKELLPNDKGYNAQYYLKEINAPKAWTITTGNSILVAVLDTGVDAKHPDLEGKVIGRSGTEYADLNDEISHGTGIAGIIAANTNNIQGIAGISWNTRILSIKITDEYGQSRVSDVISALEAVYQSGAKIVQISLSTNQYSEALKNAIQEAQNKGILIISTGGNTGINETRYPAGFNGVIGTGSIAENKELESYSTKGEHISLVAPGTDIYTTSLNYSYEKLSGTSFSAPQVAGTAALIWSIAPDLTNSKVREILINSADDLGTLGKDQKFGYGLLNTQKAVKLAQEISSKP